MSLASCSAQGLVIRMSNPQETSLEQLKASFAKANAQLLKSMSADPHSGELLRQIAEDEKLHRMTKPVRPFALRPCPCMKCCVRVALAWCKARSPMGKTR